MMRLIKELMTSDIVWINPTARVKTAVILMKGHNISALPVISNGDGVVGLVTLPDLLGESQDVSVSELMQRNFVAIDPNTTVHNAAEEMAGNKVNHLLVMEHGEMVGIISQSDLMPELGRTYDPLTELPWSDTFREWAMEALKKGMEISVILFDLDQFGRYNKVHGHVIGDRVLQEVAKVFKSGIDPKSDLVCRYGGDEFAIVSIRHADEAEALAVRLQERISALNVPGLPESVSATWGMFGGRRTKEREDIHYAATIDNLITRASKNCISNKPVIEEPVAARVPSPAFHQEKLPEYEILASSAADCPGEELAYEVQGINRVSRLKIETISFSSTGSEASAGVTLRYGNMQFNREVSGYTVGGNSIIRLFAEAAAGAVCKALAPDHGIVVDDAAIHNSGTDDQVVTVVATFITPRQTTRLAGCALVRRGDQYRAAASALLDAVNRQIELTPMVKAESLLG